MANPESAAQNNAQNTEKRIFILGVSYFAIKN